MSCCLQLAFKPAATAGDATAAAGRRRQGRAGVTGPLGLPSQHQAPPAMGWWSVASGPHDVARSPAASVPGVAGGWWALLAGGWLLGLGPGPAACCPASEVTLSLHCSHHPTSQIQSQSHSRKVDRGRHTPTPTTHCSHCSRGCFKFIVIFDNFLIYL